MFIYVVLATCFALVASACSMFAWKCFKFYEILSRIPGPRGLPILGNALQLKRDPHEYNKQLIDWCDKYKGGIYRVWFGSRVNLIIYSPEFAQVLLSSTKNINKSIFYEPMHPWVGTGLLTSSDEKWKSRRKLITSTFHFKILHSFIPVIQQHTSTLIESLEEYFFTIKTTAIYMVYERLLGFEIIVHCGKGKFDIFPYIGLCTLDIICETALGINIDAQNDSNAAYVKAISGLSKLFLDRIKKPWLNNDKIYFMTESGKKNKVYLDIVHGFTNKIINERIKEGAEMNASGETGILTSSKRKLLAFLDLLLKEYNAGNIEKEGIREEVDTFTFEGHDTTASAMAWNIHVIGRHPEVQHKLQQEADYFFDSIGDVITMEDMKKLVFTECVIKEVMRLHPPVPMYGRIIDHEFNMGPYVIPKGANCSILTTPLHRNPDHWEDPNAFKPERFLGINYDKHHPFAYVIFSAGQRNCIGQRLAMMELKITIASIFHHFHVNATQETDKIRRTGDVVLRSMEGIWIELTSRK